MAMDSNIQGGRNILGTLFLFIAEMSKISARLPAGPLRRDFSEASRQGGDR